MSYISTEQTSKIITITLTQSCNLNCTYCYENHKSEKWMSPDQACSIIQKEISLLDKNRSIEIDLFGGEPFIKFDTIKTIVEFVEKNYSEYNIVVFITTNGTLLNEERKQWLKEHTHILQCGLSYDGTPKMQDKNRSNSSSLIDLDFFATTYPDQKVKMTISKETLKTLSDGVIYLHDKGFKVSCNLAFGIDWKDEENKYTLERELMKLIEFYLENPTIIPCTMLDRPISQIASEEGKARATCGAGWNMVAYDVDGEFYPCQFFMPLSVGKEKAKKAKSFKFYDKEISDELIDPKCRDCVLKPACHRCLGSNYMATGNMYLQDENMCALTKIEYKARAYFKAMLYEKGYYNDCSESEIKTLLKSILLINEKLDV